MNEVLYEPNRNNNFGRKILMIASAKPGMPMNQLFKIGFDSVQKRHPFYERGQVGGFNIEDMVLITENGAENLTYRTPHYIKRATVLNNYRHQSG